jgi:cell division protein ZapA
MSNVTLSIGGRSFSVACADGEEAHIARLGGEIDTRVRSLGDNAGQNEVRMLLYAALVLADDLHEASASAARTKTPGADSSDPALDTRLARIADTLEKLADHLEREAPSA